MKTVLFFEGEEYELKPAEPELTGHPKSWVGKSFKCKNTGNVYKVLEVQKTVSRFRVMLDTDNDFMRYFGYDSREFRKNWTPSPDNR